MDLFFLSLSSIIPCITKDATGRSSNRRSRAGRPRPHDLAPQRTDLRLGRIVRLLMENATVVVSGTKIADEIGTSRSEVWRLAQQLRTLGVEIAGHPATGYQLKSVPDLLLPSAGIYCSVVLRPALPPSDALVLSLAAGLAVHSAVEQIDSRVLPDLKWPNDLLLNGRKFCGILTEMNAEATRVRHIVVGIGINVNQTKFPAELQPIATSLRLVSGTEWSRVELCAALLKSLDREYCDLLEKPGAHESILRRFQERSSTARGRRVRVEENGGFEGVTEGLDPRGFLQVQTAEGLRTVLSGTVRLK